MDGDRIGEARIALGSVALKPWRAREAERLLAGAVPTPETFARAAEAALADARPSGDNAYKIELARRIVVRALTLAAAGTPDRVPALPASPFAASPFAPLTPSAGAPAHA
jgi:xanthine dehydrogenase YagS FAD-binding subunit